MEKNVGALYYYQGRPVYFEGEIFRLGSNTVASLFVAQENYELKPGLGFLVFVRYRVPLKEELKQEYKYFLWKDNVKDWQGVAQENTSDVMARVYDMHLLDGF